MQYLTSANFATHPEIFQQATTEIRTRRCKVIEDYPLTIELSTGESLLLTSILEFYLNQQLTTTFKHAEVKAFCEQLRHMAGFNNISYTLRVWIENNIQKRYFATGTKNWPSTYTLKEGMELVDLELLNFVCYVAICYMKYGASYESLSAQRLFNLVEATGSNEVAKLRENGSGELTISESSYRDNDVVCKANDVFAMIDVHIKNEKQVAYEKSLDFIIRLLDLNFPKSYQIKFSSAKNEYLPIENLPQAPVHNFFANALKYPELYSKIKLYAEKAMRTYAWYTDLEDEDCAMPSTFAVLGLGLVSSEYWPLVKKYMETCDGDHSSIQTAFTPVFINKFGFTSETLPVFISCVLAVQEHEHHEIFSENMNDKASLELLLTCKRNFVAYLSESQKEDWKEELDEMIAFVWENVCYAIWGVCFNKPPAVVIDNASEELRHLYQEILL
ncbi:DUF6138 family protein [Lysinibacillus sphaericus]|uniref:DUF6138 family protein n=1 Tax=Lysinibacillus sphaericus TaxID=1421 RepID=UPI003F791303